MGLSAQAQDRRILGTWQWVSSYCENYEEQEMVEDVADDIARIIAAGKMREFLPNGEGRVLFGPVGCGQEGTCALTEEINYTISAGTMIVSSAEGAVTIGSEIVADVSGESAGSTVYSMELEGDRLVLIANDEEEEHGQYICGGADERVVQVYQRIADPTRWN